jgi:hypothetical protein
MKLFYVSYAEPAGWLGAAFVEAETRVAAMKQADEEGIAPHGNEVQALVFDYGEVSDGPQVPPTMRGRRLGREELLAFWPDAQDIMEYEDHVG